jgi:hypothetical protein
MRAEYNQRVKEKGFDRHFHSLKGKEDLYVGELLAWINRDIVLAGEPPVSGYSDRWRAAKIEQLGRMKAFFGDPSAENITPRSFEVCG